MEWIEQRMQYECEKYVGCFCDFLDYQILDFDFDFDRRW